jgi:hypothetical protein
MGSRGERAVTFRHGSSPVVGVDIGGDATKVWLLTNDASQFGK